MSKKLSAPFRHVQTPIELFDYWMPILGHVELKVLMFITRKTFGWHKSKDRISLSQIVEGTKSCRTGVCNAIDGLINHGLIKKTKEGSVGTEKVYYELVFEDLSCDLPSDIIQKNNTSINLTPPQYQFDTPPSIKLIPTKETLTKETLTKELDLTPLPPKVEKKEPNQVKSGQVSKYAEVLKNLPLTELENGKEKQVYFTPEEISWILFKYSDDQIYKAAKNVSNRKNTRRGKIGKIQSEKAYFLDSLRRVKDGRDFFT